MTGFWLVPGVHAVSSKRETSTEYIKEHINPAQFEVESRLLAIAHRAGCAPHFEVQPPATIRLRLHHRLTDWLNGANETDIEAMKIRLLEQIRILHGAGVCHRDLKVQDIVLDGDRPLFVDFELAAGVDPTMPCYDLMGPASGISAPFVHQIIGLRDGVWWDTPNTLVSPLSAIFGQM